MRVPALLAVLLFVACDTAPERGRVGVDAVVQPSELDTDGDDIPDTDGDGIPDVDEQGNADYDRWPDWMESAIEDADGDDCPDQFDPEGAPSSECWLPEE